jgi:hypothetical protein
MGAARGRFLSRPLCLVNAFVLSYVGLKSTFEAGSQARLRRGRPALITLVIALFAQTVTRRVSSKLQLATVSAGTDSKDAGPRAVLRRMPCSHK